MLNKELQLPIKIEKLQALLRRLPPHHEQHSIIKADLAKYTAGIYGEDAVQYYFNFIEKEKYTIMRDVRLTFDQNIFFQIDYLLLSANFFLILEVKNISGTLTFDSSLNQMTRISDHKEEGFPDPIQQVRRQQHQLSSWFQKMKIKSPPIHSLVVISYPSTIIKTSSNESKKYVIHAASLPDKIHQYESMHIKGSCRQNADIIR